MRILVALAVSGMLACYSLPLLALPPQAEVDILMLEATKAMDEKNYRVVAQKLARVEQLKVKLPDTFSYHYGMALSETGDNERALIQLDRYITKMGVNGKFYKEALEAYSMTEERRKELARLSIPGTIIKDCTDCPEMVVIPAGSFEMGSNSGENNEKPVHRVTLTKPFAMGKSHITRSQFAAFVSTTGYDAGNNCTVWSGSQREWRDGANWRNPGFAQQESHPVVCINWHDAKAYAAWLSQKTGKGYRLPSEAE